MDTSISASGRFRVVDLSRSEFSEDEELGARATAVITSITESLEPIFKYLSVPVTAVNHFPPHQKEDLRIVRLGGHLFLAPKGRFLVGTLSERERRLDVERDQARGEATWQHDFFEDVVVCLKEVLLLAISRREEHLASLKRRYEMLNRVSEIVREFGFK